MNRRLLRLLNPKPRYGWIGVVFAALLLFLAVVAAGPLRAALLGLAFVLFTTGITILNMRTKAQRD